MQRWNSLDIDAVVRYRSALCYNIEEYSPGGKERKILVDFNNITADMISKKTEICSYWVSYYGEEIKYLFSLRYTFILPSTHFFIMMIANRRELQEVAIIHSYDIDLDKFMRL